MRKLLILAGLLPGILNGCGIADLSAGEANRMSLMGLCQAYSAGRAIGASQRTQQALYELSARKALTQRDVDDIEAQKIRTGMRDYVAVCSWGPYSDVNTSGGAYGSSAQYVMEPPGTYVYTRSGKVESWQQ